MGEEIRAHNGDVTISLGWIVGLVGDEFGMSRAQLRGDGRPANVSRARQCAYWLGRLAGYSTPMIGRALNRDHTSVIHGSRRHVQEMQKSDEYRARCERLRLAMQRHGNGDHPPYLPLICSGGSRRLPSTNATPALSAVAPADRAYQAPLKGCRGPLRRFGEAKGRKLAL